MKFGALDRCLKGKLRLTQSHHHAHIDYAVRLKTGILPLPRLIRMSHGDGDIPPPQIRGIARSLGLKESELHSTEACHISALSVHLALVIYLLDYVRELEVNSMGGFAGGTVAMARSVELIVAELTSVHVDFRRPSSADSKLRDRLRQILPRLAGVKAYKHAVDQIEAILNPAS